MNRTVTLVDEHGKTLGEMDILKAHTGAGHLHRAFSVYAFRNNRSEILIQRRSEQKMLWPLTWANTCCSHPFPGEAAVAAGERRLQEEMGFGCVLTPHKDFVYRAEDPSGKGVEHEYVTILTGNADTAAVRPNPDEVAECKWVKIDELKKDMAEN